MPFCSRTQGPLPGPCCLIAPNDAAAAAARPTAPQAPIVFPRPRCTSEADAVLANLLAAAAPDQADWLMQERGEQHLPAPLPAAAARSSAYALADPELAWMDAELGAQHDDAEAWLLPAPPGSAAMASASTLLGASRAAAARSSDGEVPPLPHRSPAQLIQLREQQAKAQRAQQVPWQRSTFGGTPAEHGGLFRSPSERGSGGGSPTSRRSSAQSSRAATPFSSRAESAQSHQPVAVADRRLSGLSASTAASTRQRAAKPPSHYASSATMQPAATASKPQWRPSGRPSADSAGLRQRQTVPGTPAGAGAPRPAAAATTTPTDEPRPSEWADSQPSQPGCNGQLSPASKVSSWLQSAAFPADRLRFKPPAAPAGGAVLAGQPPSPTQASASAGSDGTSSWRIAVVPQSSQPAAAAPHPAATASRIPRPAATAATTPATTASSASASTSGRAAGAPPARQRSAEALKQLAQRALAPGSGGASPQAPHTNNVRWPSSLRGVVAAAGVGGPHGAVHSPSEPPAAQCHTPCSPLPAGAPQPPPLTCGALRRMRCTCLHLQHRGAPPRLPDCGADAALSTRHAGSGLSSAGSKSPSRGSHSRSCRRLSSSPSVRTTSPLASLQALSGAFPHAQQPAAPSFGGQLAAARAAAASDLAAALASARQAAADHALLAQTSPRAWEAAQAAAAAATPGSSALLDSQLAELERLCQTLSDASSQMSELIVDEAMALSRRASSSSVRRLSFLSRGSLLSLGSHASSQPGSTGSAALL